MSEYIRSVTVRVEVDTNKQTYVLDLRNPLIAGLNRQIVEFVARFPEAS